MEPDNKENLNEIEFLVWDIETDQFVKILIPQDALEAMDKASEEFEKKYQEAIKEEQKYWIFDRDNSY